MVLPEPVAPNQPSDAPSPEEGAPAPAASSEVEAYCVKCKAPRKMTEMQLVTTKNGKTAAKGKCPVCGTTMMKFLPSKKA
jgi:hypothetical protein